MIIAGDMGTKEEYKEILNIVKFSLVASRSRFLARQLKLLDNIKYV